MTQTPNIYEKAFAKSDMTDAVLVVDGKKLHVNKGLLSIHSDYFKTLFDSDFKETSMPGIPIKDVKLDEFATLLSFVHSNPLSPTAANAEKLLELADRFLLTGTKRHLELFLMTVKVPVFGIFNIEWTERLEKIRIADKYGLEDLLNQALNSFPDSTQFKGLRKNKTFQNLSDHCKTQIFNRMMILLDY